MLNALLRRPRRVFYGWWVVAAGCVINALGGGVNLIGSSVLFLPLSQDLGLSRASMSLVFSLSRAEGALESPVTGWFIDRFGPRLLVLSGAVVTGAGYLLLSQVHGLLPFFLVYLGVISLGVNVGFSPPILAAVNNWFVRHRALAMAIVLTALLSGGSLVAPLLSYFVHHLGWRQAVAIVGLTILAVVTPLSWVIRRSPESMGLRPDGDKEERAVSLGRRGEVTTVDFTVGEAVRTRAFWQIILATSFRVGGVSSFIIHFVPILVWKGMDAQRAAFVLAAMAPLMALTRIGLGWLADRWSKTVVMTIGIGIGVVAMLTLLYAGLGWQLWLFAGLFSFLVGISPLNWAIIGDFYGRRNFATIRGVMGLFDSWATLGFPIIVGFIYDRTGGYDQALLLFALLLALAALLFGLLRPPRRPQVA